MEAEGQAENAGAQAKSAATVDKTYPIRWKPTRGEMNPVSGRATTVIEIRAAAGQASKGQKKQA